MRCGWVGLGMSIVERGNDLAIQIGGYGK